MHRQSHALLLTLTSLVAVLAQAEAPPNEKGFAPDKVYQFSGIEAVDIFSGGVSLVIPIGPSYPVDGGLTYGLNLLWHSNVWEFKERLGVYPPDCADGNSCSDFVYTQAYPYQDSTAGMGWWLTLGGLFPDQDTTHALEGRWTYLSADGARHAFFPSLHNGESSQQVTVDLPEGPFIYNVSYTRDGSYLRWKHIVDDPNYTQHPMFVEYPNGTTHKFECYDGGADWHHSKWRISRIEDRFGNFVSIEYVGRDWVITDNHSRTQKVRFLPFVFDDAVRDMVVAVELSTFGGGNPATYSFEYDSVVINRNCRDDDDVVHPRPAAGQPKTLTVPLLRSVTLVDGTSRYTYSMPAYYETCTSGGSSDADAPGMLKRLTLPTGSSYEWTYESRSYDAEGHDPSHPCGDPGLPPCDQLHLNWTGLKTKTVLDRDGLTALGQWTYFSVDGPQDQPLVPENRRVVVRSPDQKDTAYYFRSMPQGDFCSYCQLWVTDWDYGLPFSRQSQTTDPGRFLSIEYFDGTVSNPEAAPAIPLTGALKVRSDFVRYERDGVGLSTPAYQSMGRYVSSRRSVNHDDAGAWTQADSYNFDGLGHYRVQITSDSWEATEWRTKTNYNPVVGTFRIDQATGAPDPSPDPDPWHDSPGHSYAQPVANAAWILSTYDSIEESHAGVTARTEFCFEKDANEYPTTGFLRAKRILLDTGQANTDLLAVFTRDSVGNVTSEQYFGGDTQSQELPDYITPSATTPLSGEQVRINHTYQYGTLKSSQHAGATFYDLDRDIDPFTGLTLRSRDSAGLQTNYEYDGLGRLTWVEPATTPVDGGAWVHYVYTAVAGSTPAQVDEYHYSNGLQTDPLARKHYEYDGLGRLNLEKQLLPNTSCGTPPCWNQRLTTYDGMGRTASVSELQADGAPSGVKATSYQYDVFGRPTTVIPPDGSSHQATTTYHGTREALRTVSVATTRSGSTVTENPVTTSTQYDGLGRLFKVIEPKTGGTTVTTTYGYDVGGHLASVSMQDDTTQQTQSRSFVYDKRGWLSSETLPEKGTNGNGTVSYSRYDARGHVGCVQDGAHRVAFEYDPAERLTTVSQADAACLPTSTHLKELTYATTSTTGNWANGKLESSKSVAASIDFFGYTTGEGSLTETFTYGGTAGATSQKVTAVKIQGATSGNFDQTFTMGVSWDDLGNVRSLTYPQVSGVGPARTICSSYANGFLVGVTDAGAGSCPGGTSLASLSYHPNDMVNVVGHGNLVTDTYGKDPNDIGRPYRISSANAVSNWDSGSFEYDGSGNIKALRGMLEPVARPAPTRQQYTYDAFSNLQRIDLNGVTYQDLATSTSTNRLNAAGFDASGNMTTWGGYTYGYDPLNAMATLQATGIKRQHLYDAEGERGAVKDVNNPTTPVTTFSLRGLDGKVLREYVLTGSAWSWGKDYVYRNGQLLAAIDATGPKHFTLDHLGSPRLITDSGRNVVEYHAYWGYGQEIDTACGAERMKFTGHERDNLGSAGALDYMHARYYNPTIGRFLAVDQGNGKPETPGSWNRYAYALGNPQKNVDADGRWAFPWEALDLYSYNESRKEWAAAWGRFVDNPGWRTGADAGTKFVFNAFDSAALLLPAVPGVAGLAIRGGELAGGAIGFAEGTARSALSPDRIQHAARHLIEAGVLPSWSTATGEKFMEIASRIMEKPMTTFDATLRGGASVKGFLGVLDGKPVVVFVYKEGDLAGKVATSFVPTTEQLGKWIRAAQ